MRCPRYPCRHTLKAHTVKAGGCAYCPCPVVPAPESKEIQ